MRKFLLTLFLLLTVALPAFAADDLESLLQSDIPAGILPSSFWYWFDIAAERVRAFMTLSSEAKVNYLLGVADEKISEAQKMTEEDLPEDVEMALSQYDYNIARAQQIFVDAMAEGKVFAQETQDKFETEILLHEKMVQMSILKIPDAAMAGMDATYNVVSGWFAEFLAHLKWKRTQIDVKKSSLTD